jgi:hypothetical protein
MRTLLIGALAATLVGCNCLVPPQAGMDSCTDAKFACLDRIAASRPIEPEPALFKTESPPAEIKSTIVVKTEKPSPAHARDQAHLTMKPAKPTMIAAKVELPASRIPLPPTRANIADSHPAGGAVATSNTSTIQEQVAVTTAAAEQTTAATPVPAPQQQANNKDRSIQVETALRSDAEKTAPAPNNTDHLVALLIARPEIKSVSDLTSKIIAIDDRHSASAGNVRTAIVAAGATEVQMSDDQTKAINRLIRGEVPAAVLALVSPEVAARFPEIAGFKIFRIPLSPRSISERRDTP